MTVSDRISSNLENVIQAHELFVWILKQIFIYYFWQNRLLYIISFLVKWQRGCIWITWNLCTKLFQWLCFNFTTAVAAEFRFRLPHSRSRNLVWCFPEVANGFSCPAPGEVSNAGSFSRHAHPEDCRKYYICLEGVAREYGCPIGTVFKIGDADGTGNCEDPEDVPGWWVTFLKYRVHIAYTPHS